MWKRVGSILRFSYDEKGCVVLDSTCFATGKHLKFLVGILNSKFGNYLLKDSPKTGTGDLLISVQAVEPIKVPIPDKDTESKLEFLVKEELKNPSAETEYEIDSLVYHLYGLSNEEIAFIENQK